MIFWLRKIGRQVFVAVLLSTSYHPPPWSGPSFTAPHVCNQAQEEQAFIIKEQQEQAADRTDTAEFNA